LLVSPASCTLAGKTLIENGTVSGEQVIGHIIRMPLSLGRWIVLLDIGVESQWVTHVFINKRSGKTRGVNPEL
jgi:hypothetical protein